MIYEQLTLYDEVDMDGKDCEMCGKGTADTGLKYGERFGHDHKSLYS